MCQQSIAAADKEKFCKQNLLWNFVKTVFSSFASALFSQLLPQQWYYETIKTSKTKVFSSNMNSLLLVIVFQLLFYVKCQPTFEGRFNSNELSQIPEDIVKCYTDRTLWDRFNRLPYSMDSLIALIRKIELHPEVHTIECYDF